MIASILIPLTVTGCAIGSPATEPEPIKSAVLPFCAIYVPVYSSKLDTEETKKQIDKNNAVWLEYCEKK
jgi:hypothetical protein